MPTIVFKRLPAAKPPAVSFILLDWSCRESFHSLDYLAKQTVPRDRYEILWLEYYDRRSPELETKIADYAGKGLPAPIDLWAIMGMERSLYYHKHLMYNVGIAYSRGDIVVICDSDAMFPANFVETLIDTFAEDENIVLHFDEVRNARQDFYPFNYPSFEELLGAGVMNWRDGKTTGLWDRDDPLHTRNYGACFCAKRADLIAIGGADEHLDYLGHVCGPYELTFRLVNAGRREIWHESVFLYHTWHPGSDGEFNYIGPSDGRHMSTTALAARDNGRVRPLVENAAIQALREGRALDPGQLIDPAYQQDWTEDAVSRSPQFKLFKHGQGAPRLVGSIDGCNIVQYEEQFYGLPHELGALDLSKAEDRGLPGIFIGESAEAVEKAINAAKAPRKPNPAVDVDQAEAAILPEFAKRRPEVDVGAIEQADSASTAHTVHHTDTLLLPNDALSALPSVSKIADDLLKITAQAEISRRSREQRLSRLEEDSRQRALAVEELRTALSWKDRIIAGLQQRLASLEQESELWRQSTATTFPAPLDVLPLMKRKPITVDDGATVRVPASAEAGHFLYGPYLHLEPGAYALEVQGEATQVGDAEEAPLIAFEIAAGSNVLKRLEGVGRSLTGTLMMEFYVSDEVSRSGDSIEFRFTHFGRADLRLTKVQLRPRLQQIADANGAVTPRARQPLTVFWPRRRAVPVHKAAAE